MTLFNRNINVEVLDEGDNLRLVGRLEDTRLGEALHVIEVEMLISVWDGEILEIGGVFVTRPMEECLEGLKSLDSIVGERIKPGFSEVVKKKVGSRDGCTHMAALLMNMGNASVQGRGGYLRKHVPDEQVAQRMVDYAEELNLLDSCVSWREDGPLMTRWRNHQGQP
jgi:hypothetical protein